MAVINGTVVGAEAGFYPKEIEQSLRLNDNDSAYLSWTPASAGNRKTWTFSTWVKRGNLGIHQFLFSDGTATTTEGYQLLYFTASDNLDVLSSPNNAVNELRLITTQVFRDSSAWYHVVLSIDTAQATSSDRAKLFVNGVQITDFSTETYPAQNTDLQINRTISHEIGKDGRDAQGYYFDGYLAETHFIDGTALDATSFGEFKNGVWIPKAFEGTYGTNGFYLPYNNDYTVEGFSAVTYRGTEIDNTYIGGVGFEPDLVWIKRRNAAADHSLSDSVRGTGKYLVTNNTSAELTGSEKVNSFDTDGFTISTGWGINQAGYDYVAWCWDAGTGSPVSNTNGTITSTVKANTERGFSIVSWTDNANTSSTVGHGLSQTPELIITKNRDSAFNWFTWTTVIDGSYDYLSLNRTDAKTNDTTRALPTSSVFTNVGSTSGNKQVAYCFHSVAGYSDFGSYTGNAGTQTVTTGFRPAFVMVKRTDTTGGWYMVDSTRSTGLNSGGDYLFANSSAIEAGISLDFIDTGFSINGINAGYNASGGTYIYMAFADTREAAFWLDQSGNNNDWENNGLTESDISLDSPTNNFATLNPLAVNTAAGAMAFYEGNLRAYTPTVGGGWAASTFAIPTEGKWYFEVVADVASTSHAIGIADFRTTDDYPYAETAVANIWYESSVGAIFVNGSNVDSTLPTYTTGDLIGIAADIDSGNVYFYKNGSQVGSRAFDATGLSPAFCEGSGSSAGSARFNFGQDSSFAGNKTPQGNTDANGRGDFYYAPPAGYLALCTANLPEPAIGPNSASTSDEHFNTVLYTGTGAADNAVSVGFQPDLTWIKERPNASSHYVFDSIRGALETIYTDLTSAENTTANSLTSFDTDGFTVGAQNGVNQVSTGYVAWNWKANGSGVSNTDGSITSTVSANVDAGFSIIAYNGTGSAGTIGHGLTKAPALIIAKSRSVAAAWPVWHQAFGTASNTDYLRLNQTISKGYYGAANYWNSTVPTSSVLSIGTDGDINTNGSTNIIYAFAEIEGFSKFGSYTGNGSADGPFVYTGFRPAFVMVKRTDAANSWIMVDSDRNVYNSGSNGDVNVLLADSSAAEDTAASAWDMVSNGIKIKQVGNAFNASGGTYIYMAFAENPFKYSNAR